MSKELRKMLDLEPEDTASTKQVDIENAEKDFDFARKNLYEIITKSTEALEDMIDLARKSQLPRAYEVVNQMIKTSSDLNQDLMDLQKKKADIESKIYGDEGKVVNQNLFVGTTADLNKIIEDLRNKNEPG